MGSTFSFFDETRFILFHARLVFKVLKHEPLRDVYIHSLKIMALFVGLLTVVVYTGLDFGDLPAFSNIARRTSPFVFAGVTFAAGMIVPVLYGLYLHLWVLLAGGRNGVAATIRAQLFADTPMFIVAWIPVIGIMGLSWSIITQGIAIREFHEISTLRTIFVVAGSLGVPLLLIFSYAAFIMPPATEGSAAAQAPVPVAGNLHIPDKSPYMLNQSELPAGATLLYANAISAKMYTDPMKKYGCTAWYKSTIQTGSTGTSGAGSIIQQVNICPGGNGMALFNDKVNSMSRTTAKKTSCPGLSGAGACYLSPGTSGGTSSGYPDLIFFAKGDIYEQFSATGTDDDLRLMDGLAAKAAGKIP